MEKIQRIKTALRGDAPDRPPYGFWTHLPGIDLDPERLAVQTAAFAVLYDMDFVKTMPNGLYPVEDWGGICDYSDITRGGVARVVQAAVRSVDDWSRMGPLDIAAGSFGRELRHFRRVVELLGPAVPVLATVFSPLTIAAKLSNGAHREHLARAPASVARGLEVVTAVTCAFAREAIARGCAGIFFALQEASRDALHEAEYRAFGEPYDRRVLDAARDAGGWFNVVHMHGENVMFELVSRYDVAALNWHIGETPPPIGEYRAGGGTRPILGGLQRRNLTTRDREAVRVDVERAMAETDGRGILLAPACVIRHPVDEATLQFTAETIKRLAAREP